MSESTKPHRRPRLREVAAQFGGTEIVTTDAPRYDWGGPVPRPVGDGLGTVSPRGTRLLSGFERRVRHALCAAARQCRQPAAGCWDDAFFFSVETFATVGFGVMAPQTTYGHIVATADIRAAVHGRAHRADLRALCAASCQH